jgi:hypothetical protein
LDETTHTRGRPLLLACTLFARALSAVSLWLRDMAVTLLSIDIRLSKNDQSEHSVMIVSRQTHRAIAAGVDKECLL